MYAYHQMSEKTCWLCLRSASSKERWPTWLEINVSHKDEERIWITINGQSRRLQLLYPLHPVLITILLFAREGRFSWMTVKREAGVGFSYLGLSRMLPLIGG